jgi:magnesium transporter
VSRPPSQRLCPHAASAELIDPIPRDLVLRILAFDEHGSHDVGDPADIPALVAEEHTVVWVDLRDPDAETLDLVQRELNLHPLAIEDASKHGQRPKLEHFNTHAFVVAYAADVTRGELVEVDLFIGEDWLITVHERSATGAVFDTVLPQDRACRLHPIRPSASFLLYVVLDAIVDSYFAMIDALGEEVDAIEDQIFDPADPEGAGPDTQRTMLDIRKRLLAFRRRVVPLREVLLTLLREDLNWMGPDTRQYLQDVFDHVMRVTDEIDMRRELLGNAVDANLAMASNHMNQIMKRMTSWGAILIVATLVAGIYGMNFDHMPELHWVFGYPFALSLMVVATGVLFGYFKRRDWL